MSNSQSTHKPIAFVQSTLRVGLPAISQGELIARLKLSDAPNALLVFCDGRGSVGTATTALKPFMTTVDAACKRVAHSNGLASSSLSSDPMVPEDYLAALLDQAHSVSYTQISESISGDTNSKNLQFLQNLTTEANRRVYEKSRTKALGPLHAAITAILIFNRLVYIVNIGDNIVYRINDRTVLPLIEAHPAQQMIYLGEKQTIAQFGTTGRPDLVRSFVTSLDIGHHLLICTASLAHKLAETSESLASSDQHSNKIVANIQKYPTNPTDAAAELAQYASSNSVQALWFPLHRANIQQPSTPTRPYTLSGGATMLWCANASQLVRGERMARQRQINTSLYTALTMAIFVSGILSGASQALSQYNKYTATATTTARIAAIQTAIARPHTPTATNTSTATTLPTLTLAPLTSPAAIVIAAPPSRTPTPTTVPTETFTPTPISTPLCPTPIPPTRTSTPTPYKGTPTDTPTATSIDTPVPTSLPTLTLSPAPIPERCKPYS